MKGAYYNEFDPGAAAWLRELIKGGHIAPGEVDERDIRDVTAADLRGFTQHHFFAGIGVWSYALRQAGWPDDRPVWTGSCPCQPFSSAGRRKGTSDERHLWPAWHWLVREFRPEVIFGEQVASVDGVSWLDTVSTDLEGEGYACGPVILPACGLGAPHIRSRIWFVADSGRVARGLPEVQREEVPQAGRGCKALGMGDARGDRDREHAGELPGDEGQHEVGEANRHHPPVNPGAARLMGHPDGIATREHSQGLQAGQSEPRGPGAVNGRWADAEWLFCRDGKWRPVEPGSFPLVDGSSERVGLLRGYGNAIVAQAAAAVITAYQEVRGL